MPPEQGFRTPAPAPRPAHDALVLAGGRARRLDGASKPDVLLRGRRLIDRALEAAARAERVVVVGPAGVAPPGVLVTLEDPPDGGPVAGIAAGLSALAPGRGLVLVLACDVPWAAGAVDALFAAFPGGAGGPDGAALADGDGRLQPLVGVYRRASLETALAGLAAGGGVRNAPVHRLMDLLRVVRVPDHAGNALDVDTWDDLARAERRTDDLPAEGL